jgi:Domain of unknown function (DUF4440)
VLAGVADADPWKRFKIEDVRVVPLGDGVAALIYTANAERASQSPHEAAVTSLYRRRDETWELVLQQQTPLSSS